MMVVQLQQIPHSEQLRRLAQRLLDGEEIEPRHIALTLDVIAEAIDDGTVTSRSWDIDRLRLQFPRWTFYDPSGYPELRERGMVILDTCIIHAVLEGAWHEGQEGEPGGHVVLAAAPHSPTEPVSATYERFSGFLKTVETTVDANGGIWPKPDALKGGLNGS